MEKSQAIRRLEGKMAPLTPGTIRYETLEAAKQFKSSWIQLGKMLWTVWKEKKFREWGYLTFEAYCAKEIGVRSATAKKLLHSYYFLERQEPVVLKRLDQGIPAQVPHLEAVNALRLLSQQKGIPASDYQQVRTQVLEKGSQASELRRQIRGMKEAADPNPEAARAARRKAAIRRMIGLLKGIRLEMETERFVPQKLLDEIAALSKKLENQVN